LHSSAASSLSPGSSPEAIQAALAAAPAPAGFYKDPTTGAVSQLGPDGFPILPFPAAAMSASAKESTEDTSQQLAQDAARGESDGLPPKPAEFGTKNKAIIDALTTAIHQSDIPLRAAQLGEALAKEAIARHKAAEIITKVAEKMKEKREAAFAAYQAQKAKANADLAKARAAACAKVTQVTPLAPTPPASLIELSAEAASLGDAEADAEAAAEDAEQAELDNDSDADADFDADADSDLESDSESDSESESEDIALVDTDSAATADGEEDTPAVTVTAESDPKIIFGRRRLAKKPPPKIDRGPPADEHKHAKDFIRLDNEMDNQPKGITRKGGVNVGFENPIVTTKEWAWWQ